MQICLPRNISSNSFMYNISYHWSLDMFAVNDGNCNSDHQDCSILGKADGRSFQLSFIFAHWSKIREFHSLQWKECYLFFNEQQVWNIYKYVRILLHDYISGSWRHRFSISTSHSLDFLLSFPLFSGPCTLPTPLVCMLDHSVSHTSICGIYWHNWF